MAQFFCFTQYIPAICSFGTFIPYFLEILEAHTTMGISIIGETISYFSGNFGILACSIRCTCDNLSWIFYAVNVITSSLIFILALAYGEFRLYDNIPSKTNNMELDNVD